MCDGSAHSSGCVVNGSMLWLPFELLLFTSLLPFLWHYVPPMQRGLGVARLHTETPGVRSH